MNVYQSESAQNKYKKWRKACLLTTLAICLCFFGFFIFVITLIGLDEPEVGLQQAIALVVLGIAIVFGLLPSVLLTVIAVVSWDRPDFGGVASCVIAILLVFSSIIGSDVNVLLGLSWNSHQIILPEVLLPIAVLLTIIGSMNIITWQIKRSID